MRRGLSLEDPDAGVLACGVAKGEPGMELARRMSSDIGRLLFRGAISYRAYSGVLASLSGFVAEGLWEEFGFGVEYTGLGGGSTFS